MDDFKVGDFTTWYQFLEENYQSGYGFPLHDWDQAPGKTNTIKLGTLSHKVLTSVPSQQPPVTADDQRVVDA